MFLYFIIYATLYVWYIGCCISTVDIILYILTLSQYILPRVQLRRVEPPILWCFNKKAGSPHQAVSSIQSVCVCIMDQSACFHPSAVINGCHQWLSSMTGPSLPTPQRLLPEGHLHHNSPYDSIYQQSRRPKQSLTNNDQCWLTNNDEPTLTMIIIVS